MVLDDRGDATKILHDKHPCNAQIGSISVPSRAPLARQARRRALADIAEAADDGELPASTTSVARLMPSTRLSRQP
jgi:hypothetical protein